MERNTEFLSLQAEEIKATMENGVLTVTFPKSTPEEAAKITIS
jgi:HSP20 family protein